MGKVFVHHPLKRAELKRLLEPPPPPICANVRQAAPDPAEIERREAERARRARERAEARQKEQEKAWEHQIRVDVIKNAFRTIWIDASSFCDWVHYRFREEEDLHRKIVDENMPSLFLDMFTPGSHKRCLYCNDRAVRHAGQGCAGLMVAVDERAVGTDNIDKLITYLLCDRCAKLPSRTILHRAASMLVMKVRRDDAMLDSIRKGKLAQFDIEYIGDNAAYMIARNKDESIGFFKQLAAAEIIINPEFLNEFT